MILNESIPLVSEELVEHLKKVFPVIVPEPDIHDIETIMYNAGQQKIIEYLGRYARGTLHASRS